MVLDFLLKLFHFFCFVFCITTSLSAQTGPAGVQSNVLNTLWLKADAGTSTTTNGVALTTWNDQSGNSNNVMQATAIKQPLFQSGILNGFPAIQFDNVAGANDDEMEGADATNLDSTTGLTIFTISRPQNLGGTARAIISKRVNVDNNESYMMFYYTTDNVYNDIDGSLNRFATTTTFSVNTTYLIDLEYDGTLAATQRTKSYVSGTLNYTANETSAIIPNYASPLCIGTTNTGDGRPFGGYIAEVIVFRKALNDAERIIVDNYLSAKYNTTMTSSDHYQGDTPANGDYDFEVAGVGNEASGNNPAAASSISGGLALTQVSGFQSLDYLMYGHQSGANWLDTVDVVGMTGSNNARWHRSWYFDVTNAGANEAADLTFDMSDGGMSTTPATASNYQLLYRAGLNGAWSEIATATSITGDRILFSNITMNRTGYYTIGTWQHFISPLPIELLNFTAITSEKNVKLNWSTATETNNNFFTIERVDASNVSSEIATLSGAGTTTMQHDYEVLDNHPLMGTSYYRIRQTDFNGHSTVSVWVAVEFSNCAELSVYPNPCADRHLKFVFCGSASEAELQLYDQSGRLLQNDYLKDIEAGNEMMWTISDAVLPGIYFLHIQSGETAWTKTVEVQ